MRVALTGAAGDLGSVLLGALSGRHDVVPIDRRPVDHPAARVVDLADLDGMVRAFEAARQVGVERIVWASSNHAVGQNEVEAGVESYRRRFVLDHRTEIRPDSLYGASKVFGEALGRLYADVHGLRVLSLRIGHCRLDDDWRIAARTADAGWLPLDERGMFERFAALWLSQRDLAQLVERGLVADYRYASVMGVSANPNRFHDLEEARRVLGYVPQDAAVLDDA